VASDCNVEAVAKLKGRYASVEITDHNSTVASQDIVFLAVLRR